MGRGRATGGAAGRAFVGCVWGDWIVTDDPRFDYEGDQPHAFIQWKGTDVCMDFHCECGACCHFDGDFAYTVRCPHCEAVWEMPRNIFPRKVDHRTPEHWREYPKELDRDQDLGGDLS